MRDLVFHRKKGAAKIGVVDVVPLGQGVFVNGLLQSDAVIVESDVKSPEAAHNRVDEMFYVALDTDISRNIQSVPSLRPDFCFNLVTKIPSATAESDLSSLGCERDRSRSSNAGGCTRYDNDFVLKATAFRHNDLRVMGCPCTS
jgi:hypothetical protein